MRSMLANIALGVILGAAALMPAQAQQDFSKVEIKTIKLSDTLYMLTGEGGNIGVSAGADGVYLIDDQYAPLSEKIMAALKAISDKPVKYVINTHWHGDHTGGNENFGKAGAAIIAHEAVRARMAKGGELAAFKMAVAPATAGALPVITFDDMIALHQNGETARVIHVDPAHTDGDAIIHWPSANVIHTGDTFVNGVFPFVDTSSGGRLDGIIKSADMVLALADDKTKIIPGHGPLATVEDLKRYQQTIIDTVALVEKGMMAGKTLEQLKKDGLPE
ncbi:MAG TPA: MBL fold metallo-hydrolase, partial [Alphaproteobacteria bacterium]|nr:MBL fold metallo-hydrolase [Alphaproteobacteria bacterium]